MSTDASGYARLIHQSSVDNILIITANGFHDKIEIINFSSNRHIEYFATLNKIVTVISTGKGYSVNLNPKDNQNKIFQ